MQNSTLKVLGIFMVTAVTIGVVLQLPLKSASAQTANTRVPPCCQDLWNPPWMDRDLWRPGRKGRWVDERIARHWTFMHRGIPAEYQGVRNPHSVSSKTTIDEGRVLLLI